MLVNDLLKPREEVIDPNRHVEYAIKTYKVDSAEDRIESNPKRFFETTYPSNAIRNMIKLVNEKLTRVDIQGGIVLSGAYGSGKSHALVTLYNIFKYPTIAKGWIRHHNIKFNLATIENNSKSYILATGQVDPDKLWEPIFKKLGREDLLAQVDRYPTTDIIEQLVGGYTSIFIDELERWFGSFDPDEEQHLIEANKMFIQNILEVAADNDKLFVFIGFLEENKELKEIINRIKPRKENMAATGDKERIIIHRLFKTPKQEVDRNKVDQIADRYLSEYKRAGLEFENSEKMKNKIVDTYPFHPKLLSVLDDIYDESATETQNVRGQIQILADMVKKNYLDKDLFLISDIDARALQGIDYKLTSRFNADLRNCQEHHIDYYREILTSILLYTLDSKRGVAEKDEIFEATIRPEKVPGININIAINDLLGIAHYLHKVDAGYLFKDERNVFALINTNAEKVDDEEAKKELAYYIRDRFFDRKYKIYQYDDLEDSSRLEYVLLLDAPHERKRLEKFVNDNIYYGHQYQNTLVIIKPNKDIFTSKYIGKMKRLIAAKQLKEELNQGEEKVTKALETEDKELGRELKEAFGKYLYWASSKGRIKIRQQPVDADKVAVAEKIKTDSSQLKDYILRELKGKETGLIIDDLLADSKKYRKNPFISSDSILFNVIEELYADKRVFIEGDNNKIYRGERVNIQGRMAILDPDYHPEVTEVEEDDLINNNSLNDIEADNSDENARSDNFNAMEEGIVSNNKTKVVETEAVELSIQGGCNRLLISNVETQMRNEDSIKEVDIKIKFNEEFSKEELKKLLIDLPDKEGSYYLEVRGERKCD